MKRPMILLTVAVLAVTLAAQTAPTKADKQEKGTASSATKEQRWQGYVVRINKDASTIDVRGGKLNNTVRSIQYDSSTAWTKQGKPADQSEFKDGSFVIVLGQAGKKGAFHASRIDLRLPR